ncbi:MAG: DNA-3-methyladenine glycosylase I [Pseudomonadota bacterium]
MAEDVVRCRWCGRDPDYVRYHDSEWGVPVADDDRLFEKLALEGFQAGLSWLTILKKRPRFREVFDGFAIDRVARFGEADVERLLGDPGIIRHRGKIAATLHNARLALRLQDEAGSLAAFVWSFEPEAETRPDRFDDATLAALTTSPAATAMSRDLKSRGWRFVGPTTVYAFMQAMGLVNDHHEACVRRPAIEALRRDFPRPGP